MDVTVIAAIGLTRQRYSVYGNQIAFAAIFGKDIVVGYSQSKFLDFPIPPHCKDMLVRIGNLRVKGLIGDRRQVIRIPGAEFNVLVQLIIHAKAESPGVTPVLRLNYGIGQNSVDKDRLGELHSELVKA